MAVAVPGEVKGYMTVYNRFGGNVSWESLFEPTIKLCEEGMVISERLAISLKIKEELIKNDTILRYNESQNYFYVFSLKNLITQFIKP